MCEDVVATKNVNRRTKGRADDGAGRPVTHRVGGRARPDNPLGDQLWVRPLCPDIGVGMPDSLDRVELLLTRVVESPELQRTKAVPFPGGLQHATAGAPWQEPRRPPRDPDCRGLACDRLTLETRPACGPPT